MSKSEEEVLILLNQDKAESRRHLDLILSDACLLLSVVDARQILKLFEHLVLQFMAASRPRPSENKDCVATPFTVVVRLNDAAKTW